MSVWDDRYREGRLPWDTGRPESLLTEMVRTWPGCRIEALDVGCGTGTNALWLARQGFKVTGLDISEEAVRIAGQRAGEQGVDVEFHAVDFLAWKPARPYGLLFDRGCLHAQHEQRQRSAFAAKAADCLGKDGLWLSLVGNRDDRQERAAGPPRWSAAEVVQTVEPHFMLLRMEAVCVDSRHETPPLFWRCLLRRR